jgi:DNA-binding FadR family transcriptional regulator
MQSKSSTSLSRSIQPELQIYRHPSAQRLHEGVVEQIVTHIISGKLPPGSSLPSETTLAQQFDVSRTVIREAVRVLAGKGLIEVKHGSGMLVQPESHWNYLDPLILFKHLQVNQDKSILNALFELWRVIEVEVVALAALRRKPEHLQTLQTLIAKMLTVLDDPKAYTLLDIAFHDTILAAAGNRLLAQTLRPARQAIFASHMISSQRTAGIASSEHSHEEIASAIERGDQESARREMLVHISQFEEDVHEIISQGIPANIIDLAREIE